MGELVLLVWGLVALAGCFVFLVLAVSLARTAHRTHQEAVPGFCKGGGVKEVCVGCNKNPAPF